MLTCMKTTINVEFCHRFFCLVTVPPSGYLSIVLFFLCYHLHIFLCLISVSSYYRCLLILFIYLRFCSSQLLVNLVTDIYLQMAIESPLLPNFLMSCSNEAWFRSVSLIWRMPSVEVKLVEKMSIILQKLSKMK